MDNRAAQCRQQCPAKSEPGYTLPDFEPVRDPDGTGIAYSALHNAAGNHQRARTEAQSLRLVGWYRARADRSTWRTRRGPGPGPISVGTGRSVESLAMLDRNPFGKNRVTANPQKRVMRAHKALLAVVRNLSGSPVRSLRFPEVRSPAAPYRARCRPPALTDFGLAADRCVQTSARRMRQRYSVTAQGACFTLSHTSATETMGPMMGFPIA